MPASHLATSFKIKIVPSPTPQPAPGPPARPPRAESTAALPPAANERNQKEQDAIKRSTVGYSPAATSLGFYRLVGGGGGASARDAARCGASPRHLGRAEDRVDGRHRVLEDQPQPLDRGRQEPGDGIRPGASARQPRGPRRAPTPGALTRCRRSCRPGRRRPQSRRGSTRFRPPAARRGRGVVSRRGHESALQPRRGWTHNVDLLELPGGGGVRHGGGDEREREGELEGLHGGGWVCWG